MMNQTNTLAEWLKQSKRAVFFGGAGVSTESGIPDFRGAKGIYSQKYGELNAEDLVSASYFRADPDGFYRFYREHLLFPEARPNPAHRALARWEAEGRISAVITQNVDGLHQAAGSRKVFELHGSAHRNHCLRCGKNYDMDFILHSEGVPHCPDCGGVVKPDVTLFGEALPPHVFEDAAEEVSRADLLIVGGTSLAVYPAASLLGYFERGKVALINLTATEADSRADLVCHQPIGAVLQEVDELLHA